MQTFEQFMKGKNRTIHPPTEKYPHGYVVVTICQQEYERTQKDAIIEYINSQNAKNVVFES